MASVARILWWRLLNCTLLDFAAVSSCCSRFSRLFRVGWVPGAHSRRKRRPLLPSFRHLSGLGLSAVLAHDSLGAVVTSFWVAGTGVDFDNKVGCSGAPSLFLRFSDAWGSP